MGIAHLSIECVCFAHNIYELLTCTMCSYNAPPLLKLFCEYGESYSVYFMRVQNQV